jgi:hypothetical protein
MSCSVYLAYITILSELMSVVQSILSVSGFSLNYVSLIVFIVLVLPALARISITPLILVLAVLAVQVVKSIVIGVGPEFVKASILVLFAAIFILMSQKMFVEDFINVLRRLRWCIIVLGLIYVVAWYELGIYRNASTFSLAIMVFLGFQGRMRVSALIFAISAKTLFQISSFTILVSLFTRSMMTRSIFVTSCVIFGALGPVILMILIPPEMVIFTASHTSSLFERLLETRTLIDNIQGRWSVWFWGDQLGWVLDSSVIEARGYVHANHLWLFRTFGFPIWLVGVFFMAKNARYGGWPILGIRTLILVAMAFLMTLFTSPLLTMFLLCRARSPK